MTNKKNTKRTLLTSFIALLLCFVMLLGTTFSWFTDNVVSSGNKIVAGTLKVDLEMLEGSAWTSLKDSSDPIFDYENWEPGYTDVKVLRIVNKGSLALKWVAKFVSANALTELADVIDVYVCPSENEIALPTNRDLTGYTRVGTVAEFVNTISTTTYGNLEANKTAYLGIALKMQEDAGNEYQGLGLGGAFDIQIVATQDDVESDSFGNDYDANAEYPVLATPADTWDGTSNVAWYFNNPNAESFTLTSAEELAGLMTLVDGTAVVPANEVNVTLPVTFEGQTIKLDCDVDLYKEDENGDPICFDPIGSYRFDQSFKGTFDGQRHTIYNLNQNTWALDNGYYYNDCGLGLFGCLEGATVKNLTIDGADISGESAICGVIAAVVDDTTFENITIKNAKCADYQYYAGGIVGWASGETEFIGCNVDASTTIAAQWGDFDNSIGGVIGGAGGSATILMKDCTVACRIDAYNDVTSSYQWYAYRRAGMLIGNTGKTIDVEGTTVADAPQLTCENVEVIYGDWANYTYCEFAGTSWPYVRVQAGVSNSGYSNPRYGHPTDANGNEVVDDNHVHNDGEDHLILCKFDQLYGGGQGVYGNPSHEGVTVTYNNN